MVNVPSAFLYQPSYAAVTLRPRSARGSSGSDAGACPAPAGTQLASARATPRTETDCLACIRLLPLSACNEPMFQYNQPCVNQPARRGLIIDPVSKPIGLAASLLVRVGLVGVCLAGVCPAGVSVTTTIAGQTAAPSLPATYVTGAELMTA